MAFPLQVTIYIQSKKSGIFNLLNPFIATTYFYINVITIFCYKLYM